MRLYPLVVRPSRPQLTLDGAEQSVRVTFDRVRADARTRRPPAASNARASADTPEPLPSAGVMRLTGDGRSDKRRCVAAIRTGCLSAKRKPFVDRCVSDTDGPPDHASARSTCWHVTRGPAQCMPQG
jgi:hypothetical protein